LRPVVCFDERPCQLLAEVRDPLSIAPGRASDVFDSHYERRGERLLAPDLKPGQVVVMDNLGAHRPKRIRELIEERGCDLVYLPPYSPDLSTPHRGSPLEDKAHPKEDRRSHQGGSGRGDGPSTGSREYPGCTGVLRSLRVPRTGAAAMKGAVRRRLPDVGRRSGGRRKRGAGSATGLERAWSVAFQYG
jgi:hypothetical protein